MINTSTITHNTVAYYKPLQELVHLKHCLSCPKYQRVSNAISHPQNYLSQTEYYEMKDNNEK